MCACITPHQMVGITDKMNRFEKSILILRERPVYPRPSIPPDVEQETALPFPHADRAAAPALGKRTQFLKIICAEQHRTARRTALRLA